LLKSKTNFNQQNFLWNIERGCNVAILSFTACSTAFQQGSSLFIELWMFKGYFYCLIYSLKDFKLGPQIFKFFKLISYCERFCVMSMQATQCSSYNSLMKTELKIPLTNFILRRSNTAIYNFYFVTKSM